MYKNPVRSRTTLKIIHHYPHYPAPHLVNSRHVIIYSLSKSLRAAILSPFLNRAVYSPSPQKSPHLWLVDSFWEALSSLHLTLREVGGGWGHVLANHPFPDCLTRQNGFLLLACGCYCCRRISAWPSQAAGDSWILHVADRENVSFFFFKSF